MAELKPGYKLTEVSVIPDDWNEIRLDSVTVKVGSGITPRGGSNVYQDYGRPFVRSQNVGWGILSLEDLAFISDEIHATFDATEIQLNDVFLNITGASIGRSAIADERVVSGNVNQHVCIIRTISDQLHPRYLNYFLLSDMGQSQIDSFQAGGNRQGLNFGQLKSFRLVLPPTLEEQRAIAAALSEVDDQITALDDLIAKKHDLKHGAMQSLFTGEQRLPEYKVTGYKQSEVGVIPEDWEVTHLGNCLARSPDYGINAPAVPFSDLLPTYIRITDISEEGDFVPENITSVDHPNSETFFLEEGDLVFARTGASVGKSYLYRPENGRLVFAGFLIRVRPDQTKLIPQYLANWVKTQQYWQWVTVMSMRSGQPGINGQEYALLPIPLPPTLTEQQAIAAVLLDMDAEISALEAKREKILALKQGMMQELLTGKTRLI